MGRHAGKTVVITGGTSGIGLATARLLLDEGAKVLVTGRTPASVEAAEKELGDEVVVVRSDTSALGDLDGLAKTVEARLGKIDLLFVNAGIGKFAPFEAVTEELYDAIHATNTKGAFFAIQKLAPLLRDGASIVLNTSVVDELGLASTSVYASSKAALRSLARTLATELLPRGIRVNAVSPGPITTPIFDKLGIPEDLKAGLAEQFRSDNPMKRFGHAEEVARAVRFFAFEATFTTGAELPVDGGLSQL